MFRNHRHFITRNEKDTSNNPPPGTGSGGGPPGSGRPLNEDIEKRYDPSRDYSNRRGRNHELAKPSEEDFQFLFDDDDN